MTEEPKVSIELEVSVVFTLDDFFPDGLPCAPEDLTQDLELSHRLLRSR